MLTPPQSNLISAVSRDCKIAYALYGPIMTDDILNEEYGKSVTQQDIDDNPTLRDAGLTVVQFQAAVYVLKMCKVAMDSELTAFVTMASL